METKINSETAFFTLNGQEFEVKKVEAKHYEIATLEQINFCKTIGRPADLSNRDFYEWVENLELDFKWQNFLISEARNRGFVSGCHFSDGLKLIYMPSGRMKLLTLSKLVTDCRNPTVIYDNGKWRKVIKKEAKSKEADEAMINKCRELIGKLTWQLLNPSGFNSLDRDGIIFIRDILNEKLNEKS